MKENIVKTKSFLFAVRVVKLYKFLCESKNEFVLSKQLLRSGTSVGAMVREAEHAETKNDFKHKNGNCSKGNKRNNILAGTFEGNRLLNPRAI